MRHGVAACLNLTSGNAVDPVRRDAGGGAAAEGCYRGGRGHAGRMPRRERLLVIIASASGDQ